MKHKPSPRSYLPLVTVRNNRYMPGACRVSVAPGTKTAKVRLDYAPYTELMACQVATHPTYYKARKFAHQELLPDHCYEYEKEDA